MNGGPPPNCLVGTPDQTSHLAGAAHPLLGAVHLPCRSGTNMDLGGCLRPTLDGAVLVDVEVLPGSDRQGFQSFNEWRNRVKVAVRAQAQHGRANTAVLSVLSAQLRCSLTDLSILSGQTSRQKTIRIESMGIDCIALRIRQALGENNGKS